MSLRIILASASPRRRALLQLLGVPFEVQVADVDEDQVDIESPADNVLQRALLKATALRESIGIREDTDALILAADTTVALDEEMLNKPVDAAHAKMMLERLRGHAHQVYTGMVVTRRGTAETIQCIASVDVFMRDYSDLEVDQYVQTGDPLDKAGAYAIQHSIFRPVAGIDGCYTAVMGLAVCQAARALRQMEIVPTPDFRADEKTFHYQRCVTCQQLWRKHRRGA